MLKSRNTMLTSAVLFLIIVILLRCAGGFFEDNITGFIGSIFGTKAENVPVIDFASMDVSWLNPAEWSMGDVMSGVNQWLHDMIDSVLPAFISVVNVGMITAIIVRIKIIGSITLLKSAPIVF